MEQKYYIITTQQDGNYSSQTKLFNGNLVEMLRLNRVVGINTSIIFALEITKEEFDYYYQT